MSKYPGGVNGSSPTRRLNIFSLRMIKGQANFFLADFFGNRQTDGQLEHT